MGSASREALANVAKLLESPTQAAGSELLEIATQLSSEQQLAKTLSDVDASAEAKTALINRVYANTGERARNLLVAAATQRWSNTDEFIEGVAEIGIRSIAAAGINVDEELLSVAGAVDKSHDLELNLGNKLASASTKRAAVKSLFGSRVSPGTLSIVEYLVANPVGRLSPALRKAARTAANQRGFELAHVTTAAPLSAAQAERLSEALARIAGSSVKLSTVIDKTLVGGIRVQIADEIIDGSVSSRLDDLRLQLAR
ncbi:MAG: ATP synthase F1 subunit delta [Microbacteriaceae bacterium]|nr:ATP synthase F1 subunit delta [Microbacteriaceae bacterium]